MLERELQWERDLFFFLNGSDSAFWDSFFYFYSNKWTWIPLYLCILLALIVYRETGSGVKPNWKETAGLVLAVVIVIALCDQIASGVFKPLFHRFRPTHHPDFKDWVDIVSGQRGGQYGFISSHAANTFGLATFLSLLFRNRLLSFTLFLFALLTAYSRIYLGLHFVSDVAVGALAGILAGYAVYRIYRLKASPVTYEKWKIHLLCSAYAGSVIILFIFSSLSCIVSQF